MRPLKIALIGFGNIGKAVLSLLRDHVCENDEVYVYDVVFPEPLHEGLGRNFPCTLISSHDVKQYAVKFDYVFLCIKPQTIAAIADNMRPLVAKDTVVVSFMAGINAAYLANLFDCVIVRAMPNLAIQYNAGVTIVFSPCNLPKDTKFYLDTFFERSGFHHWIADERHFDIITAVAGSGPAFLLAQLNAMLAAAQASGLPEKLAKQMCMHMLVGTAALVKGQQEGDFAGIIAAIASKGGTTEAGLNTMNAMGFDDMVKKTLQAAADRSKQLSERAKH